MSVPTNTKNEVWQQLLSLENRDLAIQWFTTIHSRELNARRAKEINAAAKQAREYFRNASEAAYSVRPLLAFYGVACLSRALLLLMKAGGGEEGLAAAHGLETAAWGGVMSGDVADALRALPSVRIRTTAGLFSDFVSHTKNKVCIHISSAAADWGICYDVPPVGVEVTLGDLFARIPDLKSDYTAAGGVPLYAATNTLAYTSEAGFNAKIHAPPFASFRQYYEEKGYVVAVQGDWATVTCNEKTLREHNPFFVHTYIHKMFGTIPTLYLAKPFANGAIFSQLGVTYMLSYVLGMLVRYYPTHWVSLSQGDKGDVWWPTLNRAQHLIEQSYPELVIELIHEVLKEAEKNNTHRNLS